MDLRALRDVLAVARAGSVSRAAAEMGVAQPVVTRRVQSVEASLGQALFHRNGRGVVPTEAGERFLRDLAPLIEDLDRLQSGMRASARTPQGEIALAMPPSISAAVGAPLIQSFREEYPGVQLHLVDGFSGHLTEWLVVGRVDVAVINDARRPANLAVEPLLSLRLAAVGTSRLLDHLIGEDQTASLRTLAQAPLILPGHHHGLRRAVESAAAAAGVDLNLVLELDSNLALAELLRAEFALSILPATALGPGEGACLAYRPIADPALEMHFAIAFSPQRPYTPVAQALTAHLRRQVRTAIESGRLADARMRHASAHA